MWNLLCMVDGTMHVWWNYMCWISHMFAVNLPCEKYICIIYLLWKWLGIRKNRKKRQCRLFVVCHRRQRALCRPPRTAKKPRGNHLFFLAADPFGQFAYSGRRQRQGWRTAKGSGKVGYGKELLCRLLPDADGKGAFAISGGRQRKPTAINSLLVR